MDLHQLLTTFKTERDFHNYLIARRWPKGIKCSKCLSTKVCARKNSLRFSCKSCNHTFSATAGTILHATRLPMSKWFLAISVILSAKKGVSSLQLSRTIGVNKNTAWYMQMRLRKAMKEDLSFGGIIDLDGIDIPEARKKEDPNEWRHRYPIRKRLLKSPVLEPIEENRTMAIKYVKFPGGKAKCLMSVRTRAKKQNPQFRGTAVKQIEKSKRGRYYLASIEGFFNTFKRAVIGQYHQINPEYYGTYKDECIFKYNYANDDIFNLLVTRCVN